MKKICFVLAFFVIYFLPFTITEASMGEEYAAVRAFR